MKHRLQKLITEAGAKHWSFAARRDPAYMAWVAAETSDMPGDTPFPLRAWCAATGERPACQYGRERKLRSVVDGWMFCGKAGVCQCARESVSASVSRTKANDTPEHKAATQAAREATNLKVHGHRNTGQTQVARAAHAAFYDDDEKVKKQVEKQIGTLQRLYGVDNPAHLRRWEFPEE